MTSLSPQVPPASTTRRIVSGSWALLLLLAALGGVPWALVVIGGNPLPIQLDRQRIGALLIGPDDGTVVIGVITVVAWVAWFVFAIATVSELVTVASRRRIRIRLPGLGPWQWAAGSLLLLVLSMIMVGSQTAVGTPEPRSGPDPGTSPAVTIHAVHPGASPHASGNTSDRHTDRARGEQPTADHATAAAAKSGSSPTKHQTHMVRPGDDLWSLAEHYYGHGGQWRIIAAANPDVLSGGPDRLEAGWRLTIPIRAHDRQIRVTVGDSLSAIADREYGDPAAWHDIFDANRDVVDDPNRITPGMWLHIPSRDPASPAEDDHDRTGTGNREDHTRGDQARKRHPGHGSSTGRQGRSHPRETGPPAPDEHGRGNATPVPDGTGNDRVAGAATQASVPGDAAPSANPRPWLTGITGLLAAGLVAGIATRRRLQLNARPVGRRIPGPSPEARQLETRLGRGRSPESLELADLALRAIGAHARRTGASVPEVIGGRIQQAQIELIMTESGLSAPDGFTVVEDRWRLPADELPAVCSGLVLTGEDGRPNTSQLARMPHPYPALIPVGAEANGAELLLNLEHARVVSIRSQPTDGTKPAPPGMRVLAGMIASAAFTPWSAEADVVVVGDRRWAAAIDQDNVTATGDLDRLLDRWERRACAQHDRLESPAGRTASWMRLDPDADEAWSPQIGLIATAPDHGQLQRLRTLVEQSPPAALAVVMLGPDVPDAWRLLCDPPPGADGAGPDQIPPGDGAMAVLEPLGWRLVPQHLSGSLPEWLEDLLAAAASTDYAPAPWWAAEFPAHAQPAHARPDTRPPDTASPVRPRHETESPRPGRDDHPGVQDPTTASGTALSPASGMAESSGWPSAAARRTAGVEPTGGAEPRDDEGDAAVATRRAHTPSNGGTEVTDGRGATGSEHPRATGGQRPSEEAGMAANPTVPAAPLHPTLLLLGPTELVGGAGEPAPRAARQCIEYCAWLLEHPGRTAQQMAAGLLVAEGTRRSNMSRLRRWLGSDDRGEPYLPDAYSGRIALSPLVSSDWHHLQLLCASGVNRTSTDGLRQALRLVRGAPLADATPGQWTWAEEMRTDMVSVVRDIGVELAERALSDSDLDLARWAVARALTAAGGDETLLAARIRTEHRAGNHAEVERLGRQVSAQSRAAGLDLDPETVDLLQQVMEGGIRARTYM